MRYAGTVLTKELNSLSKRRRTFALRVALTGSVMLVLFLWMKSFIGLDPGMGVLSLAMVGRTMFYTLGFLLLGAGFLLTPAYCAPLICSEREKKTLEIITSTPIRYYELIFGKLSSRVLVLVLVTVSAVPLMFVCLMFGGVSLHEIGAASGIIISNILLCAGFSIIISSLALKSGRAIARTYSLLILAGIASGIFISFTFHLGASSGRLFYRAVSFVLVTMNPFAMLSGLASGGVFSPGASKWFWFIGMGANLAFFILSIFLSSLILTKTMYWEKGSFLRVFLMGDRMDRKLRARRKRISEHKPVKFGRNPIYWKECIESILSRPNARIKSTLIIFVPFFLLYILTLFKWQSLWFEHAGRHYHRSDMVWPHMAFILGEFAIAFFSSVSAASSSVVKERSKKTLDSLLLTPLTSRSIWLGKFLGACRRNVLLFMIPFVHIGLCILHGILEIHALWLTAITATTIFLFFIVVGIGCSIRFSKRTNAIVATLLVAFTVFAIIPFVASIVPVFTYYQWGTAQDVQEMIISLSPWYWLGYPLVEGNMSDFYEFGVGYFWFLTVYGFLTVILAITSSGSLRERLSRTN